MSVRAYVFGLLLILPLVSSCALSPVVSEKSKPPIQRRTAADEAPNYPEIFQKSLEVLKLETPEARRSSKSANETQVIEALQNDPALLSASKEDLLKVVQAESLAANDLTKHLRLIPPKDQPGYSNLNFYADHPYYFNRKTIPSSNLISVWRNFLLSAKKTIVLNVFDFDLEIVAKDLVKQARRGVKVQVGIDKNTIALRPEVKKVYDQLIAGGVNVAQVNSVSLNHQKMASVDWENVYTAKVLFSSGNLTQSCLGPEGDLKSVPAKKRPKESIPNANHVITMNSWLLANLVHHELTKTLDPSYSYRGSQYPTTGSYQITGPGVDPNTLEAYPENSLIISFSPGGGFRNINRNLIAHFVKNSEGPVRMMQFAYSSEEVSTALLERARRDFQDKGKFDFESIGDTPFAMQFWSQFLKMSGLEVSVDEKTKRKSYVEVDANQWFKNLTPDQLKSVRQGVRIAPAVYGNNRALVDGKKVPVSAKIHHKILTTGPYAILGTSFNFSQAAESNNEQILIFKDPRLLEFANGMVRWMSQKSPRTVYEEAQRRNNSSAPINDEDSGPDSPEDRIEQSAK